MLFRRHLYSREDSSDNKEGPTGDIRELQQNGVLTKPISGPAEVSPAGDPDRMLGLSFYDES